VDHIAVYERDAVQSFGLAAKFDFGRAPNLPNPAVRAGSSTLDTAGALYAIAQMWIRTTQEEGSSVDLLRHAQSAQAV
jgi:hypothetical protein